MTCRSELCFAASTAAVMAATVAIVAYALSSMRTPPPFRLDPRGHASASPASAPVAPGSTLVGTGQSALSDPQQAVREAATQALKRLDRAEVDLVVLFASAGSDGNALVSHARREFGSSAKIFGGTSDSRAVLTDQGYVTVATRGYSKNEHARGLALMAIGSKDIAFGAAAADLSKSADVRSDTRDAALRAVGDAGRADDTKPAAVLVTPTHGVEEEAVLGIQEALGRDTLVLGGTAGGPDGAAFGPDGAYSKGISLAVLYTDLPLGWVFRGGFSVTGMAHGTITKADGRDLVESEGGAGSVRVFWKLFLAVLCISTVGIAGIATLVASWQIGEQREHTLEHHRQTLALIAAQASVGQRSGQWPFETLRSLSARSDLAYWFVVTPDGVIHLSNDSALMGTRATEYFPELREQQAALAVSTHQHGYATVLIRPMQIAGETWSMWLVTNDRWVVEHSRHIALWCFLGAALSVLLVAIALFFVVRGLLRPIHSISDAARRLGTGDMDARAHVSTRDELGDLAASFNTMADKLQTSLAELAHMNQELEVRAERRARVLAATKKQLDATARELMDTSRKAGMAEVATTVLHNVGNVLNSVTVSASLAAEHARNGPLAKLAQVCDLLEQHRSDLARFVSEDPKGRLIVPYLQRLAASEVENRETTVKELDELREHIEHIRAIVTAQQSLARTSSVTESFDVQDLLDDILRLAADTFATDGIDIVRDFGSVPLVTGDRHRLLQIVTTLLTNARHAVQDATGARRVVVRTRTNGKGCFAIDVEDTGCGIRPENLEKVFAYGFTTKPHGHGFGLHGSACAANGMGGRIQAYSDGPGRGAKFTVELPLDAGRRREEHVEQTG